MSIPQCTTAADREPIPAASSATVSWQQAKFAGYRVHHRSSTTRSGHQVFWWTCQRDGWNEVSVFTFDSAEAAWLNALQDLLGCSLAPLAHAPGGATGPALRLV